MSHATQTPLSRSKGQCRQAALLSAALTHQAVAAVSNGDVFGVGNYCYVTVCSAVLLKQDDGSGGDNWSNELCKALVKSSSPINRHAKFNRPDALRVTQPTVSKH